MNIIIVGRGVIGTTYGSILAASGHTVQHLLRGAAAAPRAARATDFADDPTDGNAGPSGNTSAHADADADAETADTVHLTLLDGRVVPPAERMSEYVLEPASIDPADVDLVLVSVPADALPGALESLRARGYDRRLLLMGGVWMSAPELRELVGHDDHLLGYPIAGGRRDGAVYETVLFDSVRLQRARPGTDSLHASAVAALESAGLSVEQSDRMLEWLWVHQAVNAGIIAAIAARHTPGDDLGATVRAALGDATTLRSGIRNIRECLGVVRARGVSIRHHVRDVAPFTLVPAVLSSRLMVTMFRRDVLSRRIMELHHNLDDILALMADVERSAREYGISTPGFDRDYRRACTLFSR
jgi:ketopantoate reductase